MSRTAFRPELDGSGGGLGRYRGLPVREIEHLFANCTAQPSMRAATAVLRIAREQLDARGNLGAYPRLAMGAGAALIAALVIGALVPQTLRQQATIAQIASASAFLPLLYGSWSSRQDRRASLAQEREIRRLARLALEEILAHDFDRKPLLREQEATLREILRHEPSSALSELLP